MRSRKMQAPVLCASPVVAPPSGRLGSGPGRRAWRRWMLRAGLALALGWQLGAAAQAAGGGRGRPRTAVRFGILPLGGAFESRNDWEPLLADLSAPSGGR